MIEFNKKNSKFYNLLLKFLNLKIYKVFIAKNSIINNTIINDGTRINGKIIIKGQGKCIINKYCAIGDNVRIITSNHSTSVMNLQYALQIKLGLKAKIDDKKDVTIGHNAWIGDSVIILPGVIIGNGAVVGAGSLITKSVPAYAIVGGVPARTLKFRFDSEKIRQIEKLQWWDWSFEQMQDQIQYFIEI
jgi:virginiamycin A acetyltransferase